MPSTRNQTSAVASGTPPAHSAPTNPLYSAVMHGAHSPVPSDPQPERVQAGFSLRLCSANVCVFPIATRNKFAPVQAAVAMLTTALALKAAFSQDTKRDNTACNAAASGSLFAGNHSSGSHANRRAAHTHTRTRSTLTVQHELTPAALFALCYRALANIVRSTFCRCHRCRTQMRTIRGSRCGSS